MLNNTIEDNLNNSDLNSEENDWFDDLNDNIPKLPTNGMPHAAYKNNNKSTKFWFYFSSDLSSALWLAASSSSASSAAAWGTAGVHLGW